LVVLKSTQMHSVHEEIMMSALHQTPHGIPRYHRDRLDSSFEKETSLRIKQVIFAVTIYIEMPALGTNLVSPWWKLFMKYCCCRRAAASKRAWRCSASAARCAKKHRLSSGDTRVSHLGCRTCGWPISKGASPRACATPRGPVRGWPTR
jgi:hypothetical protein